VAAADTWLQRISDALGESEYHASVGRDGLQAPNRAQSLRTFFGDSHVTVTARGSRSVHPSDPENAAGVDPSWQFVWRLTRFGREGTMRPVAPAVPRAERARVTYDRGEFSEWYENRPAGVEQGFDVSHPPLGEGPVCFEARVSSDLAVTLSSESGAVEIIDDSGACVLRYGELRAWEATGRDLPARLSLEGGILTLHVDDRGAVYPVTVDPLMASPAWTAESDQPAAAFGASVATAGDVDGDGFSDVIVGAPYFDRGETDEGLALVYLGSPTGLGTFPFWTAESDQASARFGASVAAAGDVNGDGYGDVLIGAEGFENGEPSEGGTFLYLGSAVGLAASPAWTAESNQVSAYMARSVTAGDVDGNGYDDVLVGAFLYDNGETDEGRAFLYLGSPTGLATSPTWTAESDQAGAWFGFCLSTAGDVNGDGYDDVIIGAAYYDSEQSDEGRAFIYMGSPIGLAAAPSWTAEPNVSDASFGYSVAGAGDVDGDGYADVIVGAPIYANGQMLEGAAFLYRGGAAGPSPTASWSVESNQIGAHLGTSVATAGDVDGDGFADVIVGVDEYDHEQNNEGQARVYGGSPAGLSASPVWDAESNRMDAHFGSSAATAGDVNGDGFSDVIVGAPGYTNGETTEGGAFVYHGSAGPMSSEPRLRMTSSQTSSFFASSLAPAGDVNGDGYSDLVVGAPYHDNGEVDEGAAFVFFGEPDDAGFGPALEVDQAGAHFGNSVAHAGDVNGDGYADVLVGAPDFDNGQTNEGRAYLYLGTPDGLLTAPAWAAESDQAQARFGHAVAGAGDVNGDGFSDVIVGAYQHATGGRAFVYLGSSDGLLPTPSWQADAGQSSASFGISVAGAGDVNGDGFSDVVVGATFYDDGQTNEGAAFLYLGSSDGLGLTPSWTGESNQAAAAFGVSVATAGDVNGDGFSDVFVGASGYDGGETDEGAAFLYLGSAAGLALSPVWRGESQEIGAQLGYSVSTAGDVNGDGLSDIVVGAPFFDGGETDRGVAVVLHGRADGVPVQGTVVLGAGISGDLFGFSVALAGDVNGDGFSDVLFGAPLADVDAIDSGSVSVHLGNEQGTFNAGLDRIARQLRAGGSAPIAPLGATDYQNAFRIAALGRTAGGRGHVWLEWEVKPAGVPFDGGDVDRNDHVFQTAAPDGVLGSFVPISELVTGLEDETMYHWRARIASDSPFFPRTPWLTVPYNAVTEMDFRTAGAVLEAQDAVTPASAFFLEPIPVSSSASLAGIAYALPSTMRVRLAVYDVQGRECAVLDEGLRRPGRHVVPWDGRSRAGAPLAGGLYFVRLEGARRTECRKMLLLP
jgi:hypothetical protein